MNAENSLLNQPLSSEKILSQPIGELAPILKTIHQLKRLNDLLEKILPPEMTKHCQVAGLNQGKLTLTFDNASWASKFYFEKSEYLSQFRRVPEFSGIIHINHSVNPGLFTPPPQKIKTVEAFSLSANAQDSLEQLILSSNGKLREKLEKLRARLNA